MGRPVGVTLTAAAHRPGPAPAAVPRRALARAGVAQVASVGSLLGLLLIAAAILGPEGYREVGVLVSLVVFIALAAHLSLGQSLLALRSGSQQTAGALARHAIACSVLGGFLLAWRASSIGGPVHELPWPMAILAAFLIPLSVWEAHQAGWLIANGFAARHNRSLALSRLVGLGTGVVLLIIGAGTVSVPLALGVAGLVNLAYGMGPHRSSFTMPVPAGTLRGLAKRALALHLAVVVPLVATQAIVLLVYSRVPGAEAVAFQLAVQAVGLAAVLPLGGSVHLGATLSSGSTEALARARHDVGWLVAANVALACVAASMLWLLRGHPWLDGYEQVPTFLLGLLACVPGLGVVTAFLPLWIARGSMAMLAGIAATAALVAVALAAVTSPTLGVWSGVVAMGALYGLLFVGGLVVLPSPERPRPLRSSAATLPSDPKVVAVVAHFKGGQAAIPTLSALLEQRSLAGLVIVDDGAGGPEADDVERWLSARTDAPWHAFVRLPINGGPASAFAAGLEEAVRRGADLVWLSDQDMRPLPGCLAALVEALRQHPDASGATPLRTDPATGTMYRSYAVEGGRLRRVDARTEAVAFSGITVFSGLLLRDPARAVRLLPRDLFIDSDDFLFTLRLSHDEGVLLSVPDARADHECGQLSRRWFGPVKVTIALSPAWRLYYRARNQWHFTRAATASWPASALMYARTFAPVAVAHLLYQRPRREVVANLAAGVRDAARVLRGRRGA